MTGWRDERNGFSRRLSWVRRDDQAAALYDTLRGRLIYAPSQVANMGYWEGLDVRRFQSLETASDALFRRVLGMRHDATIAESTSRSVVLDVGCGYGGLLEILGDEMLNVGVNVSFGQLARRRPGVRVAGASASSLPLRRASVSGVVSVEAAHHFHTRRDFYAEARRVLEPSGWMSGSELVVPPARGVLQKMTLPFHRRGMQFPQGNVGSVETLRGGLEDVGFEITHWEEATGRVIAPFKRWLIRHLPRVLLKADPQYVVLNAGFLFYPWKYVLYSAQAQ